MTRVTHLSVRRGGFSLIELLIVVAIIAALVGVAVPMFQKNIAEAHRAKAKEDLDTIRNAITLHDSQNRPLIGTSLKPLLGRYLQEIPKDPWGNDYMLDAGIGIVVSFGADQKAGGNDEDEDLTVRYKSALKVSKVTYDGSWGLPSTGARFRLLFNKPFSTITDTATALNNVELIQDPRDATKTIAFGAAWKGPTTWEILTATGTTDPSGGVLVISCKTAPPAGSPDPDAIRITPNCAVNVSQSVMVVTTAGDTKSNSVIKEQTTTGGPCDQNAFGSGVLQPDGAHPIELVGPENRGVPIERR